MSLLSRILRALAAAYSEWERRKRLDAISRAGLIDAVRRERDERRRREAPPPQASTEAPPPKGRTALWREWP